MKRVAILQSNYIPWKGYFDIINSVDEFVLYDEMQYTKNDWRNRNIIKTQNGPQWISIPVKMSGLFGQKINETKVLNNLWRKKHWKTIKQNYSKATFFKEYEQQFEELYLRSNEDSLSEINISFIKLINEILGIKTIITKSKEFNLIGEKSEKLVNICKTLKANIYISGPAAKNYLDIDLFNKENIEVKFIDYSKYKEYHQLHGKFEHYVSVLDLIFNEGNQAVNYI